MNQDCAARALYTSSELHAAIKQVLSAVHGARRIVMVAYVGKEADAFLPSPEGLEIICSLEPGATHPEGLRKLVRRGALVLASDRLHMKVYWSSHRGAVIGSANATRSALGRNGLKEAGVMFPPGAIDIDRLLAYAEPRRITRDDWKRLDSETDRLAAAGVGSRSRTTSPSFGDWLKGPHRKPWKIGWWTGEVNAPRVLRRESESMYGIPEPYNYMLFAQGQAKPDDWFLCFRIEGGALHDIEWFHPDFVVRVPPDDPDCYEPEYPYAAAQVRDSGYHPNPPFDASERAFRAALKEAVVAFGRDRIVALRDLSPPSRFLGLMKDAWNHRQKGKTVRAR